MGDSVLLSLLARQLSFLGERFSSRYPHGAWLVWEPSEHVRPASAQEADAGATRMPSSVTRARPAGSDAVCFPLTDRLVTVGRASTNNISIDDMSMSRDHFLLFFEGNAWNLALAEPVTCGTRVRNMWVEAKKPVQLVDGCRIVAGDVELTFHEAGSLLARLVAEQQRSEHG